jgi:hypothetical protein
MNYSKSYDLIELQKLASQRHHKLWTSDPAATITASSTLYCACSAGHQWKTTPLCIYERCEVCVILKALHRGGDRNIEYIDDRIHKGSTVHMFNCTYNHVFAVKPNSKYPGSCKVCWINLKVTEIMGPQLLLDTNYTNIYMDDNSRLRYCCTRIIHNRGCDNPACIANGAADSDCSNYVHCNQEFYTLSGHVKYTNSGVFNCKTHYEWPNNQPILTILYTLEILLCARFDDRAAEVYFTGYNAELRLAFIVVGDTSVAQTALSKKWALESGVDLFIIPVTSTKNTIIMRAVVTELCILGRLPASVNSTITELETELKRRRRVGESLLINMCSPL